MKIELFVTVDDRQLNLLLPSVENGLAQLSRPGLAVLEAVLADALNTVRTVKASPVTHVTAQTR